ncbi:spermine oxidase-like [Culicoides brevitarsis]|uniref:spermine oxidase-like n=1 Tax=Culicoides brevitarsis TaxID=469753 RepID=UPI00307B59A8
MRNLLVSIFFATAIVSCYASDSKDKKVVIVGAGAAGIAAARELFKNGYKNVQILEAQDYYGGRIREIFDEDGQKIEFGAKWVEGRQGNSAYKILQDAGVAPDPDSVPNESKSKSTAESVKAEDKLYVQSNGDPFPADDLKPFFDAIDKNYDEIKRSTELLSDFIRKKFEPISDDKKLLGLATSYAQIMAETDSPASDWEQTIGIGFGQRQSLPGGQYTPPNGVKQVCDLMMSDLPNDILKLKAEVTKINYDATKPIVTYLDHTTNETHSIETDFVIVTVSLGVLKASHETLFQPQLPEKMTKAIESFNFGLENQIYLKFNERWWPSDKELVIIWRPEDKAALQLNDRWLPKIEVYAPYNNDTLMVYVMESEKYHTDDLTEQELIEKIMPIIRRGFQHQGWSITNPTKVYHSRWYANPFVRGALSYPTLKSHQNGCQNSDLAPILKSTEGKANVFFAGEATSQNYYGSVHGAIDSGVEAAKNIMTSGSIETRALAVTVQSSKMFPTVRTTFIAYLLVIIGNFVPLQAENDQKIVVIGAGASGLAATAKLLEHGYRNIVILEAEDRIGGRVWTVNNGDKLVEMGAQWIMGETGNILYEMAKKHSLLKEKIENFNETFVKSNGESIPDGFFDDYYEIFQTLLNKSENNEALLSNIFKNHVEEGISNQLEAEDKHLVMQYFKNLVESVTPAVDWNHETGSGISSFESLPGSTAISMKTGLNALLFMIMNSYPSLEIPENWKEMIHFNAKAKHINWNQDKPFVQYSFTDDTKATHNIEADYIIVTIPLGVLKHDREELFVHPLPEKKIQAIENLSFGTVNKVFLTFEEQWWPNGTLLYTLFTEHDLQSLEPSDKWLSNIVGFFPEEHYPATLSVWFAEKDEVSTESHLDTEIYTKLTKFIKKVFANQGWSITDPIKTRRTKWQQATNFRGSYSYRGVNASKAGVTFADLREPLRNHEGKITVLFAGEATHDKHYSTLHGAVESGFAAAQAIMDANKSA